MEGNASLQQSLPALLHGLKAPHTIRAITQPSTRCGSPCPSSLGPESSNKPQLSRFRYPSTPASSRRFADCIGPNALFSDIHGDKSNALDHQVKLALTDLLNCANTKADQDARSWLQNKLLETEHRLKARKKNKIMHGDTTILT
ncbi:hypothetical protein FQN57_005026 [Myotisia sp. PD_48]|nr:hypothetical protein FQN57_005026 [Myotisia sp. PD_48]